MARTREERAPAQEGRGSLSGSGVLVTRSGTVEVTFFFVDDAAGVAIVNVNTGRWPNRKLAEPGTASSRCPSGHRRRLTQCGEAPHHPRRRGLRG